jgi:hypothetical protein
MRITIITHNDLRLEDVSITEQNYKETESYFYRVNKGIYSIMPKEISDFVCDFGQNKFLGEWRINDIDFDQFSEEIGLKVIPCSVKNFNQFGIDPNSFFVSYKKEK